MHEDLLADPRFGEGRRLFDAHEWFECHEVLEAVWRDDPTPARDFFQGLIMAAVALEHWRRGNPRGARSQWAQGRRYLEPFHPRHGDLEVSSFVAAMDRLMEPIMAADDETWRDPGRTVPPLPYDDVPKMRD